MNNNWGGEQWTDTVHKTSELAIEQYFLQRTKIQLTTLLYIQLYGSVSTTATICINDIHTDIVTSIVKIGYNFLLKNSNLNSIHSSVHIILLNAACVQLLFTCRSCIKYTNSIIEFHRTHSVHWAIKVQNFAQMERNTFSSSKQSRMSRYTATPCRYLHEISNAQFSDYCLHQLEQN